MVSELHWTAPIYTSNALGLFLALKNAQQRFRGYLDRFWMYNRASIGGGDMRFGLFGLLDFPKLVFLNHRNFGDISLNLNFYCILIYNLAKFF